MSIRLLYHKNECAEREETVNKRRQFIKMSITLCMYL